MYQSPCFFNHAKTKILWPIFQFHIALSVKNFFFKEVKKVDGHRNVQVKYYSLRSAGGDFSVSIIRKKCRCKIFVVISEKNYFTEYERGYVCITVHRYVIRKYYLLCETLVEHPTSFVEASQKRRSSKSWAII